MSPMALLLVLLVLAYIGSLWVSSERKRAFGSPSGVEYVVLGALLGPEALGVLGHGVMSAFEPVMMVALGWLGLVLGLECGVVGTTSAPAPRLAIGIVWTALTAGATACAVYAAARWLRVGSESEQLVLAGALGLVSAETTRHAVRWLGDRQVLTGPLPDLLVDIGAADDAPVMVALAFVFALMSGPYTLFGHALGSAALFALTLGAGVALGTVSAWLLRRAVSPVERWTVLLGAAWLATGLAKSLGLSALAATFALGLTVSALSHDAPRLRTQVGESEGAVLLPALLLAGAHLELPRSEAEVLLIALAIGTRVLASFLFGCCLSFRFRDRPGVASWLGAGMLSSGTLTTLVGFGLAQRAPADVGRPALVAAVLGTLIGELIGPAALKRAFGRTSAPPPPLASSEVAS